MREIKSLRPLVGLTAVGAMAVAIGIWVGLSFGQSQAAKRPGSVELANAVTKLEEVLGNVERDYVDETDMAALSESTISTLLQQLDPHSTYLTAKELAANNVDLQGELEGIGIEFSMLHDMVYVIAPISGGPAEQVGIQAGDKIVKVDDQPFSGQGLKLMSIVEKLRGTQGTKVKLTVQRHHHEELLDFTVTRAKIPIHSVDISYMVDDQVGYIKVSRFSPNTFKEFKAAYHALQKQGMTKLLLDLRSNPGGYMDMSIKLANSMLKQGQLIVYTKGKKMKYSAKYHAKGEDNFERSPVIVLINEGTASAAEIVAGALQDNDRALIVGRRSFGKGLVQVPMQLQNGSQIRLTVARYYTPSGRFIQRPYGDGIDYHAANVEFDEDLKYQTSKGRTVYGGGGIMPDYLIPQETSLAYFEQPLIQHVLHQYVLEYVDQHRESLNAMGWENYYKKFEVTESMLKKLVARTKKAGITYDARVFRAAKRRIIFFLKAHIARRLWRNEGFYPIAHQEDEEFQKALRLFDEAEALLQQPAGQE